MVCDFLSSPTFGLIVAAILAELRAAHRGRQARKERRAFRDEVQEWLDSSSSDNGG